MRWDEQRGPACKNRVKGRSHMTTSWRFKITSVVLGPNGSRLQVYTRDGRSYRTAPRHDALEAWRANSRGSVGNRSKPGRGAGQ